MKNNKSLIIFSYILTVIFVVACVIGGTIAGNKLSELKEDNKKEVSKIDTYVKSEQLIFSDSYDDVLELIEDKYEGSFEYANYLATDREPRYLNISISLDQFYMECIGCQTYELSIGDKTNKVNGFSNVKSYSTKDDKFYFFVYRNVFDSVNKADLLVANMYDEELNLIKEDMYNLHLVDVSNGNDTSTYIMFETYNDKKIEFHRYTISDNNDYIYYSIDNIVR